MKIFLLSIYCVISYVCQAQLSTTVEQMGGYLKKVSITLNSSGTTLISGNGFEFNALAAQLREGSRFDRSYFISHNDTIKLTRNVHDELGESKIISNLIFLNAPVTQIYFHNNSIVGHVDIFLINSTHKFGEAFRYKKSETPEDCSEPISINQAVWRAGLAEPTYTRGFSTVKHVIVHHSAGSNSSTDFTEVVRGIYIYHTEVNGWSDIGYNYLIAPDGTIFKGRDPATGEQDNVIGAHFCGKNTGTMGICLLGTFTNVAPKMEALKSLQDLITWKVSKNEIDPLGSSTHTGNILLNSIAGHRDGCATECPGQQTYNLLGSIRNTVSANLVNCAETTSDFSIYPNPITLSEALHIQLDQASSGMISLHDSRGSIVYSLSISEVLPTWNILLPELQAGLYFLSVHSDTHKSVNKIVVLH